jgi:hypothetical protein
MKVHYCTGDIPSPRANKYYSIKIFGDTLLDCSNKKEIINYHKKFCVTPFGGRFRPDKEEFEVWYSEAIAKIKEAFKIYLGVQEPTLEK